MNLCDSGQVWPSRKKRADAAQGIDGLPRKRCRLLPVGTIARLSDFPKQLTYSRCSSDQRASLLQLQKESNNSFSWTITLPGTVCGFTRASYQSLATTLALYGALKAYLKEPLEFPGTRQKFGTGDDLICAALLAEFDVWAAVEEKCGGEVL